MFKGWQRLTRVVMSGIVMGTGCADGGESTVEGLRTDSLVFSAVRDQNLDIYLGHTTDTSLTRLTDAEAGDNVPRWSPDGSRLLFQSQRDGNYELYVMNADGSGQENLSRHPLHDGLGVWSPDGERIAFFSAREVDTTIGPRPGHIYLMHANGTNLRRLTESPLTSTLGPSSWSPDGSRILLARVVDGAIDLFALEVDTGTEIRLTDAPATRQYGAHYSPDGEWIVFHVESDSGSAVAIMPADGPWNGEILPLPSGYYYGPTWSPDGQRLVMTQWNADGSSNLVTVQRDGSGLRPVGPRDMRARGADWR